jgi:hypothetical protein
MHPSWVPEKNTVNGSFWPWKYIDNTAQSLEAQAIAAPLENQLLPACTRRQARLEAISSHSAATNQHCAARLLVKLTASTFWAGFLLVARARWCRAQVAFHISFFLYSLVWRSIRTARKNCLVVLIDLHVFGMQYVHIYSAWMVWRTTFKCLSAIGQCSINIAVVAP